MAGNRGKGKVLSSDANQRRIHERGITASARRMVTDATGAPGDVIEDPSQPATSRVERDPFDDESDMESASYSNDDSNPEDPTYMIPPQPHIDEPKSIPIPSHSHVNDQAIIIPTPSIHPLLTSEAASCPPIASKRRKSCTSKSQCDDWCITTPMPGGPRECSQIPSYGGHVARKIWEGIERPMLKAYSRPESYDTLKTALKTMVPEAIALVGTSGLSHLPGIMYHDLDMPLITAFVERWQPDTNTFHLPFGEMTIMLHDVCHILGLRVDGDLPCWDIGKDKLVKERLMHMFGTGVGEGGMQNLVDSKYIVKGGVDFRKLMELTRGDNVFTIKSTAWLLAATGVSLFTDKSRSFIRPHHLLLLEKDCIETISWGAMTLAYLYRQLGMASRFGCAGMAGCLTLLQAWIYEYFHCFRPQRSRLHIGCNEARASSWDIHQQKKDDNRLMNFRLMLDRLRPDQVTWTPYGDDPARDCPRTGYCGCINMLDVVESYMPDRCLRQLGYVQVIPASIITPDYVVRSENINSYLVRFGSCEKNWNRFRMSRLFFDDFTRCTRPGETHLLYPDWFVLRSHPILTPERSSLDPIYADENSPDWWLDEFYRSLSPLLTMPDDSVPSSEHWKELKRLGQRYGEMRGFLPRGDT